MRLLSNKMLVARSPPLSAMRPRRSEGYAPGSPNGFTTFSILDARTDMWKEFGASMGVQTTRKSALLIFITLPAFAGCASHGAPSFVLFGAFFPAWMLCAIIGIFGAIAARGIFVAARLDSVLPFQLFVCSSVGLVVAALTWLIWFG